MKKSSEQFTVQKWIASLKAYGADDPTTKHTVQILDALTWPLRIKILQESIIPFWKGSDELGKFYQQFISLSPEAWERMKTACSQAIQDKKITPRALAHSFVEVFEGSDLAAAYFSEQTVFLVAGEFVFFRDSLEPVKFSPTEWRRIAPIATKTRENIVTMFAELEKHCRWNDWDVEEPSDDVPGSRMPGEKNSVFMLVPGSQFIQFHPNSTISLEYIELPERRRFRLDGEGDEVANPIQAALESFRRLSGALENAAVQ